MQEMACDELTVLIYLLLTAVTSRWSVERIRSDIQVAGHETQGIKLLKGINKTNSERVT
jgi:hypothetical protein